MGHGLMDETKVEGWKSLSSYIDGQVPDGTLVAYGLSRSIRGRSLLIDFGDEQGELAMVEITFRDEKAAWAAYCKAIRLDIKVVKHPPD